MRNSVVIPVMGVMTVIAGAVGLQLGESAIAQIDPVHFSGPRPIVRDVSRAAPAVAPASYASAYGWAEGHAARDLDCRDCGATMQRPVYALPQATAAVVQQEPWRAPVNYDRMDYEEQPDTSEWREVSRYVHYPVTQEHADAAERLAMERASRAAVEEAEPVEAAEPAGL